MTLAVASKPLTLSKSLLIGICDSLQGRAFDRLMGVSTRGVIITEGSNFITGGDDCAYAACQWLPVHRALKDLRPKKSDVFVDLGSGKGKALLIAGRLPYREVIGIEIDKSLAENADQNITTAQPRFRASCVKNIVGSVLEWPIPNEASVIFIFNPFTGKTFHDALTQVFESYDREPRNIHVVYGYPWEHDWLLSTGRVTVERVRPSVWPPYPRWWQSSDVIIIYRVIGNREETESTGSARRSVARDRALQYWSRPNGHQFTMTAPGRQTLISDSKNVNEITA